MVSSISRPIDLDDARVLVIGDLMLDRFRYGAVSRISPEAPVAVLHVAREEKMLGGAGNVAANIVALGAQAGLIAIVGNDEAGRLCAELLAEIGGDPAWLVTAAGRPTTLKTRFISGSQQLLRCDEEDASAVPDGLEQQLIERFDAALPDFTVVAVSDYSKGLLGDRVLRHVIARCRAADVPIVIDPKRRDFAAYAGASVIKPNRSELAAFSGLPCGDFAGSSAAADDAMAQTGAAILLTLSEDGMALYRAEQPPVHFHATATEVFDVSGAGDTALAVFCAALAADFGIEEAAMLANAGAGAVVRKLGTATLSQAELAEAVADLQEDEPDCAVCTRDKAAAQVELWKQEGLRVGFTNGCFDIVHAGHIEILRQSRALCDRLVVGLNSDASVARLKGAGRPIQPESSRAAVLAAINTVDVVVVFDEDTPLELITALGPTELIKGADYREDQVVGGDLVKAQGGRVHLIELVPGLSTTRAVERIRQGLATGAES